MHGWMDGGIDDWWIHKQIKDRQTDGLVGGWVDGQIDGQVSGWIHEEMHGLESGWVGG